VRRYHKSRRQTTPGTEQPASPSAVRMTLEDHLRRAIQDKLPTLLEEELQEYLGRSWYERHQDGPKQYRNGYGKPRTLSSGVGDICVQVPR